MKHTPGPWTVHDAETMRREFGADPAQWHGYAWVGCGGDERGKFQSMVADLDRRNDGSKEWRERATADAKLIAAAPELLETLKALEVAANTTDYCYAKRPKNFAVALKSLVAAADKAREVITKAE